MRIDVITLFPGMFQGPLTESIIGRAQEQEKLSLHYHDLREYGLGNYNQTDDEPYGGGAGMVMRVDVCVQAIEAVTQFASSEGSSPRAREAHREEAKRVEKQQSDSFSTTASEDVLVSNVSDSVANEPLEENRFRRILLSARGDTLTQQKVEELAQYDRLLLLCGHYEGVDQRVVEGGWIDEEISIGDYVLTGGELPAMVLIDTVARHIPGVLGREESIAEESFSQTLGRKKEYPHYTRPDEFRGLRVPDVLLSGHHKEIEEWRRSNLL